MVLQTMFALANANQTLFPATLPGTKIYSNSLGELVDMQREYLFGVFHVSGRRGLVLCINSNVYLINSKLFVTNVTKHFPAGFCTEAANLTLIDGDYLPVRQVAEDSDAY
jgi:hypothetical protein